VSREVASLTWSGREFQALAAATGNVRSPSVERHVDGISTVDEPADRRRYRVERLENGQINHQWPHGRLNPGSSLWSRPLGKNLPPRPTSSHLATMITVWLKRPMWWKTILRRIKHTVVQQSDSLSGQNCYNAPQVTLDMLTDTYRPSNTELHNAKDIFSWNVENVCSHNQCEFQSTTTTREEIHSERWLTCAESSSLPAVRLKKRTQKSCSARHHGPSSLSTYSYLWQTSRSAPRLSDINIWHCLLLIL